MSVFAVITSVNIYFKNESIQTKNAFVEIIMQQIMLWIISTDVHINFILWWLIFTFFLGLLDARRRSSPGACLPSSASPHLSLMARPGVNSLHSSGAGPYLNTVSFSAVLKSSGNRITPATVVLSHWFNLARSASFQYFIIIILTSTVSFICWCFRGSLSSHYSFFSVCFCVSVM